MGTKSVAEPPTIAGSPVISKLLEQYGCAHAHLPGRPRPLLPTDGGDCEEVLANFANAGIDVDALAIQLQGDGAKSFIKSWNDLMAVITSKSATLNGPLLKAGG